MPLASAVSYSIISIAITLINKAVLTSFGATRGARRAARARAAPHVLVRWRPRVRGADPPPPPPLRPLPPLPVSV